MRFFPNMGGTKRVGCFVALDEVGRGCVAGPVVVAATLWMRASAAPSWYQGIRDSKRLTPDQRRRCFGCVQQNFPNIDKMCLTALQNQPVGNVSCPQNLVFEPKGMADLCDPTQPPVYVCQHMALGARSAHAIDRHGIIPCLHKAAAQALSGLPFLGVDALLVDGSQPFYVPKAYQNIPQYVFPKADDRFISVGLSSIVAKVMRDCHMERLGVQYPEYCFEKHKGYGTAQHMGIIEKQRRNGQLSPEHRKSFLLV